MSAKPTKTFREWCEEKGAYELLRCYEAGDNPVPADIIGFSSPSKVNFHCQKCGYTWKRTLNQATCKNAKYNCPSCNGRVSWGENSWTKKYPELLDFWDYEKNENPPEDYNITRKAVHWRCRKCRNQWMEGIKERVASAKRIRRNDGELCPYCGKRRVSPNYNLAVCYPEIAKQWDYNKNGGLRPEDCFPASGKKVWWRCSFDPNHSWQDEISNRTILRRGCPHCFREFKTTYTSRVLFYYLRQVFPDCVCEYPEGRYHLDLCLPSYGIAIEHHGFTHQREEARKRDICRREELLKKGYKHVLWLVESDEPKSEFVINEDVMTYYDPAPYTKTDQLVCHVFNWLETLIGEPVHYEQPDHIRDHGKIEDTYFHERKKRSVAACYPELVKEWSDKNTESPDIVMANSHKSIIWKCLKCGKEYNAIVANRIKHNSGCPYCAHMRFNEENSIAVRFPHLLADWGEDNDKSLYQLLPNSKYIASWVCHKCGYHWKTTLYNRARVNGSRCPNCAGTIPTEKTSLFHKRPELAAFWHPEKNGDVTPDQVMAQSNKKWWWRCEKGHEWQGAPYNMAKKENSKICPYCANRKVCVDNCLQTVNPQLAAQWHPTKNGGLTPNDIIYSSQKSVWWVCEKGHSFRASPYSRHILHSRCPYCINYKVGKDNCLANVFPDLAKQWHPEKNGDLTPDKVMSQSSKIVWWRCEKGHEWQNSVYKRSIRGQGCPYCAGRRVSAEHCLAKVLPHLAAEWDAEKNGDLTPWDVAPSSNRKVWWRCEKGHSWQASISNRRMGRGCPMCVKHDRKGISLDIAAPELTAQWHPTRNALPPSAYMAHSNKKVWWLCEKGHEWQASPDLRMNGRGCPYCSGRLASKENCLLTLYPSLAEEWDYEANQPLTPEQVLPHTMRKVNWVCKKCGHRWSSPVAYRVDGSGCPVCRKKKKRRD